MSTSVASPLREVTNELHVRDVQTKKPIKADWSGVHLKFDDEGNSEAVMKEEVVVPQLPLLESDPEDEDYSPSESEEESDEEEEVDENEQEETENADLYAMREQTKVSWCGKRTVFPEDEEVEEETTETPSQEVDQLSSVLSQMSTNQ